MLIIISREKRNKKLSEYYGVIPKELDFLLDLQLILDKMDIRIYKNIYTLKGYQYDSYRYDLYNDFRSANCEYSTLNRRTVALNIPHRDEWKAEDESILKLLPMLQKLKFLSLPYLNSIPKTITSLRRLKGLALAVKGKAKFPSDIINLKSLTELYLSENFFKPVSKSLYSLIKQNVAPKYIKNGVCQEDAVNLGLLDAYFGQTIYEVSKSFEDYTTISYEINELGRIIAISLQDGENYPLEYIPRFIFNFTYLEKLHITNNWIHFIPYAIKKLRYLKELNLSYNPICLVPKSITSLKSLEKLELSQHRLQEFPEMVLQIPNLKYLDLVSDSEDEPKPFTHLKELITTLKLRLKKKFEVFKV